MTKKEMRAAQRLLKRTIVAGYLARKTLVQIAYEAGCSESWVSTVARRAGCIPRHAQALNGKPLRLRLKSYSEQRNRNRRVASG